LSQRDREVWADLLAQHRAEQGEAEAAAGADLPPDRASKAREALALQREAKRARLAADGAPEGSVAHRLAAVPKVGATLARQLEQLQLRPVRFVPLRYTEALVAAVEAVKGVEVSDSIVVAVARELFSGLGRQLSITAAAEHLEVDRKTLRLTRLMLSAALVSCSTLSRLLLETRLAQASVNADRVQLLMYLDCDMYDEASMPLRVSQMFASRGGLHAEDQSLSLRGSQTLALRQLCSGKADVMKETGTTKLLQASGGFAMLLRVEAPTGPRFVHIIGECIAGLQVVDRTTAEVLRYCCQLRNTTGLASRRFPLRIRCAAVDHYQANLKSERVFAKERGFLSLVVGCESHSVSNIHAKTMLLLDYHISGCINLALSVEMAGYMNRFRDALRQVIKRRLVWPPLRGSSTLEATSYILRAIASLNTSWSKASQLQRRVLLELLPNGNWLRRGTVEVHINDSVTDLPPKQVFAESVADSLTQGLCWEKFQKYPRHRWFGAEASVMGPTLLEVCHGLLRPAFELFCEHFRKGSVLIERDRGPIVRKVPQVVANRPWACFYVPCCGAARVSNGGKQFAPLHDIGAHMSYVFALCCFSAGLRSFGLQNLAIGRRSLKGPDNPGLFSVIANSI